MLSDPGIPIVGYRFVVVIATSLLPNPIDIRFQEVSGLSMKRTVSYEKGMITLDGKVQTQTLTLKRGVFTGISPLIIGNIAESLFWDTKLLRKDLLVTALDDSNIPIAAWVITNAYLDNWQWESLNATNNAALLESMSFVYTGIKYLPLKLTKTT